MEDKEGFLRKYKLKDKLRRLERDNPLIWEELNAIYEDFKASVEGDIGERRLELKACRDGICQEIGEHAYIYIKTSRIKDPESLIVKIINKKYEGIERYDLMHEKNYERTLTDLVGVRLIHKFVSEWEQINELLYQLFYKGDAYFVQDYAKEYRKDLLVPFLIEKPVVNHLPDSNLDMYKAVEEKWGRSLFQYKPNNRNYRSVHYLVNYCGIYTELQVRTLSDELWGEMNHDFVYKLERSSRKDALMESSDLLRVLLLAGDTVSMYMKEQYNDKAKAADWYIRECEEYIKEAEELLSKMKEKGAGMYEPEEV